jgi:protein tyrosine phosphatase (PTP) superfamily phosphohydrolase (DUF442 family)
MVVTTLLCSLILASLFYCFWRFYLNYNFGVVSRGKVYKSGAINPDKLSYYTRKHKIKTVIDFRREVTRYSSSDEKLAIEKLSGVNYIHIPSKQIPDKQSLQQFYEAFDNLDNYPMLIHCYHGTGRTMLYAALYRIEYENFENEAAREKTRCIVDAFFYKSSFAPGKGKGDFLINYKPRRLGGLATINTITNYSHSKPMMRTPTLDVETLECN